MAPCCPAKDSPKISYSASSSSISIAMQSFREVSGALRTICFDGLHGFAHESLRDQLSDNRAGPGNLSGCAKGGISVQLLSVRADALVAFDASA